MRDDIVTNNTPKWKIARQAAELLEEAENLLEMSDISKALARDIRTLEVEVLRYALNAKE